MKGGTFTDRQTVRWDIPPPRVSVRPFVCRPTASFVRSFVHFAPFSLSLSHLGRTPFCAVVAAFIVQPDGVERARMGAVFVDSRACSFWTLKRFLPHVVGDGRRSEERTTAAAEGTTERTNGRNFGEWQGEGERERASTVICCRHLFKLRNRYRI